ncbi:MAG: thioredoxin domain-containing protein [Patescibacteria group bacterium]|nr:thioredoxin domain-containing protein [Patescibacteria group bacterium]
MSQNQGVKLSPKTSFALGMVGGVLVLCTIGFFVLLGMIMNGDAGLGAPVAAAEEVDDPTEVADTVPAPPQDDGPTVGTIIPIGDSDYVIGPADADVTLITYTDFECPYCSRFHSTFEQALEDFDGQVRATIRHFPLSFHSNAASAANASECAGEQGKFFEFVHDLFTSQGSFSNDLYEEIAGDLGLKMNQFRSCIESDKYADKVSSDAQGGEVTGVRGTPGTLIISKNGEPQLVPGAVPYSQLKLMIESAL